MEQLRVKGISEYLQVKEEGSRLGMILLEAEPESAALLKSTGINMRPHEMGIRKVYRVQDACLNSDAACLFLAAAKTDKTEEFRKLLKDTALTLIKSTETGTVRGVYMACRLCGPEDFTDTLRQCMEALRQRFLWKTEPAVDAADYQKWEKGKAEPFYELERFEELEHFLNLKSYEEVLKTVEMIFLDYVSRTKDFNVFMRNYSRYLTVMDKWIQRTHMFSANTIYGSPVFIPLLECKSIGNICRSSKQLFQILMHSDLESSTANYSERIQKVITYLNLHFKENLPLWQIADELGVNESYLCRIFKAETGKTISQFLTEIKINQAVSQLLITNKKVYHIAEELGYTSVQYFTKIFKAQTGCLPGDFRNGKYT